MKLNNMKPFFFILLILSPLVIYTQDKSYIEEIKKFQKELNKEFRNPDKSPLSKKEQNKFKGHDFFPINDSLCVKAKFIKTQNPEPFKMKTTKGRAPIFEKYGEAIFQISGKEYKLCIYQSHKLRQSEKYKDYLFLPFTDLTNGDETYGGGRYIDLSIPISDILVIDFNKAYNPYCAYSSTLSCPVPPKENHLNLKIEAGMKTIKK